jgi:hypothetical protein
MKGKLLPIGILVLGCWEAEGNQGAQLSHPPRPEYMVSNSPNPSQAGRQNREGDPFSNEIAVAFGEQEAAAPDHALHREDPFSNDVPVAFGHQDEAAPQQVPNLAPVGRGEGEASPAREGRSIVRPPAPRLFPLASSHAEDPGRAGSGQDPDPLDPEPVPDRREASGASEPLPLDYGPPPPPTRAQDADEMGVVAAALAIHMDRPILLPNSPSLTEHETEKLS